MIIWIIGIGVFLLLLFAFPRPMLGLIVLCGVGIGGLFLSNKIKTEERTRLVLCLGPVYCEPSPHTTVRSALL